MENNNKELKIDISIREALSFGWKKFYQRALFFVAAFSIWLIFPASLASLIYIGLTKWNLSPLFFWINSIIWVLFQIFLIAGFFTIIIKTSREENPSFRDFLGKANYIIRLTVGHYLYALAVLIGSIFLIIPGLFLAVRFFFFYFFIVDKNMKLIPALKKSYEITKGYGWKMFLLIFVVVPLFYIVGIIILLIGISIARLSIVGLIFSIIISMAFLVGIFILVPTILLALAFFYNKLLEVDLKKKEEADNKEIQI